MLLDGLVNRKVNSTSEGDSNLRSFAKTISWRVLGTLDTIVISYAITGETSMALSIGSVEVVSKMLLYYFHERAWAQVKVRNK